MVNLLKNISKISICFNVYGEIKWSPAVSLEYIILPPPHLHLISSHLTFLNIKLPLVSDFCFHFSLLIHVIQLNHFLKGKF